MFQIQLKRKRKNYLCLSIIATSLLLCLSFVNRLKWIEWKWLPAAAFEIRNHIQEISPLPDWIDFKTHYKKNKTLKTFSINLSLPFPIGAASPFRSCDSDLFGEPGDSHKVKGSVLRISNFPAWSRNFSSSFDRRLNCSLWDRHFSSSSRTLA